MKPRTEAVKFITAQLDGTTHKFDHPTGWHYGKCELRQLMDFIYGGHPATDEECLGEPLRLRNAKVGKWEK